MGVGVNFEGGFAVVAVENPDANTKFGFAELKRMKGFIHEIDSGGKGEFWAVVSGGLVSKEIRAQGGDGGTKRK